MPTATKTDDTDLRTPPAAPELTATDVELPTSDGAGWNVPMAGGAEPPPAAPDQPASEAATPVATVHQLGAAQLGPVGHLGTRDDIQYELDRMAFAIRSFSLKQPDQVMREIAAYSARLTELEVLLHRVESLDRQYTRVRTMQVQKWLEELDRQFKIASRLVEVMRQDIELQR